MNPKVIGAVAAVVLAAVLFWPGGSSQKVKTMYEEAETLYKAQRYEEAITKYNLALEETKKRFVKTDVIDKDFKTLAKYKIAVSYSNLAELGDVANYDKAQEIIEEIYPQAKVRKHQEGITYLWGHVLFKKEQYEESEPKFRELIDKYPDSLFIENAWYAIGNLNYKLQKYDDARIAFKSVLDNFPHSDFKDDAQHLIAQSFLVEENYEQAFAEFDRLTTEEFKNYTDLQPEAKYKAAYSLSRLGRDDEAIARYNTFVTEHPESGYVTAAYFDMGAIYAKQKDYDNARTNYELALQNTQDLGLRAEIQKEIGRNYFDQEDYQNAITAYEKLLDPNENPENLHLAEAKYGIANSYSYLENWSEAITAYQRLINEHPEEEAYIPFATFQVGEAHYQQQDFENSLAWYQKVLDTYPESDVAPHSLYGAIWSLSELGRDNEVQTIGENFIQQKKEDPDFDIQAAEIQMKLGDIQFKMKNYGRAAVEYAKVWDEYQNLPKFFLLKLNSKFQEGLSHFNAAAPSGYKETDKDAQFNEELLRKSVASYRQAVDNFSDEKYDASSYDDFDFPERLQIVEGCQMNQASTYEKLKDFENARKVYATIPRQSEHYERSQLLIAQTYQNEGNISKAIEEYQKVLDDDKISSDSKDLTRLQLAQLLQKDKRYTEAAVAFRQIVDSNPQGEYADDSQYLVGVSYYQTKNIEDLSKSIDAFQKVIDNYPQSPNAPDAYYGIVLAYRDLAAKGDEAQWANVISVADTALEQFGASDEEKVQGTLNNINLVKIKAIEESKGTVEGIDALVDGLRKIIDSPVADAESKARAHLKIGHFMYEVKRYQDAIPEYEALVNLAPNSELVPMAQYQLAVCHFQLGQAAADEQEKQTHYQSSVERAELALVGEPDADMQVSVYYAMGLAEDEIDDKAGAIDAFRKVISLESDITDEKRRPSIYDSHTRLAGLYSDQGDHESAIQEYEYTINNTQDKDIQARSYFAIALTYDENIKDYDQAITNYQEAIPLTDDALTKAQAFYRIGLLYAMKLNEPQNALTAFDQLVNSFTGGEHENVKAMIADASVRGGDLYYQLGMLDEAIVEAEKARDSALQTPGIDITQQVQAQYQVGLLHFKRARSLYNEEEGSYNEEYRNYARQALDSYLKTHTVAIQGRTIESVPKDALPFVRYGLYQGGEVAYSIHFQPDIEKMISALEIYVKYTDQGLFGNPKTDAELNEHLQKALSYLGSGYFDLSLYVGGEVEMMIQGDATQDEIAEKEAERPPLFSKAANTFKDLVRRFPTAADGPRWQYHAGEAYFANKEYRKALTEYEKVQTMNPQHESAPDAIYAMATCYQLLSQEATGGQKQQLEGEMYALNEKLAIDYPNSEYAAEALINVANNYYNQGSMPETTEEERERFYELAVEAYKKALALPNIKPESKVAANDYLNETEVSLAVDIYTRASRELTIAKRLRGDEKKQGFLKALAIFEQLTEGYPDTGSADIAYDQIGDIYVSVEEWQKALDAYETLMNKYPPNKPAVSSDVNKAVRYAQQRYAEIRTYMLQLKVSESTSK